MRPVPTRSPVTGADLSNFPFYIHADTSAGHFRDSKGRCLLLRGINLASSAKTPIGQPSHQLEGFWEGAESGDVSFVNRVLDLDVDPSDANSADTHLQRLRSWGFNVIRYITTWESIEHKGPYVGLHICYLGMNATEHSDLSIRTIAVNTMKSTSSIQSGCSESAKNMAFWSLSTRIRI